MRIPYRDSQNENNTFTIVVPLIDTENVKFFGGSVTLRLSPDRLSYIKSAKNAKIAPGFIPVEEDSIPEFYGDVSEELADIISNKSSVKRDWVHILIDGKGSIPRSMIESIDYQAVPGGFYKISINGLISNITLMVKDRVFAIDLVDVLTCYRDDDKFLL
jgi:hypothetical protein